MAAKATAELLPEFDAWNAFPRSRQPLTAPTQRVAPRRLATAAQSGGDQIGLWEHRARKAPAVLRQPSSFGEDVPQCST